MARMTAGDFTKKKWAFDFKYSAISRFSQLARTGKNLNLRKHYG